MNLIKETLGLDIEFEKWSQENIFPYYLTELYKFKKARTGAMQFILIEPKDTLPVLPSIQKHMAKIQKISSLPVVLYLQEVSFYRRKALLQSRIPFIAENKQIYLPFLGTNLSEISEQKTKTFEKILPSAQMLFFKYIYADNTELLQSEMANILKLSEMTVSRATRQLEQTGLFEIYKNGVKKYIVGKKSKKDLFEAMKPYLSSPVMLKGYTTKKHLHKGLKLSGLYALSELTMINPPESEIYAANKGEILANELTNEFFQPDSQVQIEIWKYNPKILSKSDTVDILSLVLSLSDEGDERVEKMLDQLLDKLWEEING